MISKNWKEVQDKILEIRDKNLCDPEKFELPDEWTSFEQVAGVYQIVLNSGEPMAEDVEFEEAFNEYIAIQDDIDAMAFKLRWT